MVQYIFSPEWFYGIDIIFEAFSLIIALLIARFGYKLYKISDNENHKHFSVFFFLIALALALKIIANYDVYYLSEPTIEIANEIFYFTTSRLSELLFILWFSASRFLMMVSFFGLLYITGERRREIFIIVLYFIGVITLFSEDVYYIFHITMSVILLMLLRYYYLNYKGSSADSRYSFLIALSFIMLLLSQIAFALISFGIIMYVVGEIVQLAGFSIMLCEYFLVTRNES
jgi:hypothetical protein